MSVLPICSLSVPGARENAAHRTVHAACGGRRGMADGQAPARVKAWGVGLAVVSSVCFGGSGVAGKSLIGAGLTPLEAVWLRIASAVIILLPLLLPAGGAASLRTARPH